MFMYLQVFVVMTILAGASHALTELITTTPAGCLYRGVMYPEGDFRPSPCEYCQCHGGQPLCAIGDCFITNCVDAVHDPKECCPQCPNGHNCLTPDNVTLAGGHMHVMANGQACLCDTSGNTAVCSPPPPPPVSGCTYHGTHYPVGSFKPSPCQLCTCPEDGGHVICAVQDCAIPACKNPVHIPDKCCPLCPVV